ncbi:MAG: flavin reductase family protein [Conexivisphaerales archaeon]
MKRENTIDIRAVMRYFADGVTIVTGVSRKGDLFGITVTSFTSVSLSPPLVLVCIANSASATKMIKDSRRFCVNLLTADQKDLSERFAYVEESKRFLGVKYKIGRTGSPILEDSCGYIDCTLFKWTKAGDHTIFLGNAIDVYAEGKLPLIYYNRGYYTICDNA